MDRVVKVRRPRKSVPGLRSCLSIEDRHRDVSGDLIGQETGRHSMADITPQLTASLHPPGVYHGALSYSAHLGYFLHAVYVQRLFNAVIFVIGNTSIKQILTKPQTRRRQRYRVLRKCVTEALPLKMRLVYCPRLASHGPKWHAPGCCAPKIRIWQSPIVFDLTHVIH